MQTILGREPVLILAVVGALMALLLAFGVDISTGQKAAIDGFAAAVLALIARSTVTPVADLKGPS